MPLAGSHVPATWHWSKAVQTTGLDPTQLPFWQLSLCVQALPSLQLVPLAAVGLEHLPVAGSQVPATWHWSKAVQTTGLDPTQLPFWQLSLCLLAWPSLQLVLLASPARRSSDLAGSHVPATWHWSKAVQTTGLDPTQLPFWQLSLCVQALPSLQLVPLAAVGLEHLPVAGSQVPATWHWSKAVQTTGLDPTQLPFWQLSLCLLAWPSLQLVLLASPARRSSDLAGSHVPATWHWSKAVQTTGLDPTQLPFWQLSLCVQALPSLQLVPLAAVGLEHLPVAGSQVPATWHWSKAVQTTGLDPTQLPFWQLSLCLLAWPSLQLVLLASPARRSSDLAGSHVPATWHWSKAVQTTGLDPTQLPFWQLSLCVQALPSLQLVPLAALGLEHVPVAGSHVHIGRAWCRAVQTIGLDATPLPGWQLALCVQALPSLQLDAVAALGFEQVPVAESHVLATWHWSKAVQTTGLDPTQLPFWQLSLCVQALPSLQLVPLAALGLEHVPVAGSHV